MFGNTVVILYMHVLHTIIGIFIYIFPCVLKVSMIPKSIVRMDLQKYVIRTLNINFVLLFPVFQNTIREKIRTYLMMTISCEVYEHIWTNIYDIFKIFSTLNVLSLFSRFSCFFFVLSFIIPAKTGKMSSFFVSSFRNERKIRVTAFFLLWRVIFFLPSLLIYSKCSCGLVGL